MKKLPVIVLAVLALILFRDMFYVVSETNQVIITQFGEPKGQAVQTPGLKFKLPFIQKANYFEKRWLEWDGDANQIPTKDKKFIWIDTYARWRISDPLVFFQRVRDERGRPVAHRRHRGRRDPQRRGRDGPHRNRAFIQSCFRTDRRAGRPDEHRDTHHQHGSATRSPTSSWSGPRPSRPNSAWS